MRLTLNPYDDCVATDKDGATWIRADEASPWWKLHKWVHWLSREDTDG